jgi:hypothetical protein
MQFEITKVDYGQESETDEKGDYTISITIGLKQVEGDLIPPFSKNIEVINNNSQTGYEVDKIRQNAIADFLEYINK